MVPLLLLSYPIPPLPPLLLIDLHGSCHRHEEELQEAMEREGFTVTDKDINTLTRQHVMEKEVSLQGWRHPITDNWVPYVPRHTLVLHVHV